MKTQEILVRGYLLGYMQKQAVQDYEAPDGAVADEDFDPEDLGSNKMTTQGSKPINEKLNLDGPDNQPVVKTPDDTYASFLDANKSPIAKQEG